jgi:hypothetical protein
VGWGCASSGRVAASKGEVLCSNPSTVKNKKKKTKFTALGRQRQEDLEFKAIVNYTARSCLNTHKQTNKNTKE